MRMGLLRSILIVGVGIYRWGMIPIIVVAKMILLRGDGFMLAIGSDGARRP
jgi:hypothetical protein